ncbi:MAG: hypothetical protein ACOVRK_05190 [Chryseobacterium taeanense]
MRKKQYILLILLIFFIQIFSAQTIGLDGSYFSAPSAASLPNFIKSPVSLSTGVQDVSFPLFTLKTRSSDITVDTGLAYHPNNSLRYNRSTDVGLGWSLYGAQSLIYKETDSEGFPTNNYYYSFLGKFGKFTLKKNASNEWVLHKINNNKLKISFSEVNNQFTFKIIDELGNNYFFDVSDVSYAEIGMQFHSFTSAYYLSKITNVKNQEILSYQYLEDHYNVTPPGTTTPIQLKGLKLQQVVSPGLGFIQFNYLLNESQRRSYNDPFQIVSAELKTVSGKTIGKYGFQYETMGLIYPYGKLPVPSPCSQTELQNKRTLKKLLKYDRLNNFETTEFTYGTSFSLNYWTEPVEPVNSCFENEAENPKYLSMALLHSVKYPTGSEVRYEYEPNQYFVDKNTSAYKQVSAPGHILMDRDAQYYESIGTYSFDTHNGTLGRFILSPNPHETDGASYLFYYFNVDEYYTPGPEFSPDTTPYVNVELTTGINSNGVKKYLPGSNDFKIVGTGGKGTLTIWRIRYKSVPLPNYSTGKGVRIKKIEYYENNTLVNSQTKQYYYQKFDDNNMPSGFMNTLDQNSGVVYKNVKEIVGNNGGYTKYYFKTLDSYPENLNADGKLKTLDLKYANILDNGLLHKTEVYDKNDSKVTSEINDYEFYELTGLNDYGKNAVIRKHIIASASFLPSGTITQISESVRDMRDFNISYKKSTEPDGDITEEFITYPWGISLEDPRLMNAGIKDIPLKIEVKRNGNTISKAETRYENTAHFFATSQWSALPDNLSQYVKNISYDIYVDKGNLVQYTSFPDVGGIGKSTTVIWGYNQTMPIAKIEGAKLSDIPASLITAIVNASNDDANASETAEGVKEKTLIDALNNFRNNSSLADFIVTGYTYDLLIGITTAISPNGMMEIYKYDASNRLEKVLDVNGNTIKEFKYNYKH